MNTTVDALKALYVAWGGTAADVAEVSTIPDMIEAIVTVAPTGSGSGASLPTVTAADNGKVLGVVDGTWAVMEIPTELPTVSADDNGDILKVVDGAWAKATS